MLKVLAVTAAVAAADWRPLEAENTLVIETTKGQVVVEMQPVMAPRAVERIKRLAREGTYDGLQFHRVIDGFVAQTGNPNNRDGGGSKHPDLPPEFQFRAPADTVVVAVERSDGVEGFVGSTPFAGVRMPDGRVRGWGAYCPGVAGMGRQEAPATANSEIFFMRAPARRLDHEYTVWGRVVAGQAAVLGVAVGEPPKVPDLMLKVRVLADLPAGERPRIEVLNERGKAFQARLAALKRAKGAAFTICDVQQPTRVTR